MNEDKFVTVIFTREEAEALLTLLDGAPEEIGEVIFDKIMERLHPEKKEGSR